jgi:uncharacterized protein YkwD
MLIAGSGAAAVTLVAGCAGFPGSEVEGRIVTGDALSQINAFRQANGRPPLSRNRAASRAALAHARTMAKSQTMAHNIGFGADFSRRMQNGGVALPAAENIAAGQDTVARALRAWENSASHRRNTLDERFTGVGVAVAYDPENGNDPYWAMVLSGG